MVRKAGVTPTAARGKTLTAAVAVLVYLGQQPLRQVGVAREPERFGGGEHLPGLAPCLLAPAAGSRHAGTAQAGLESDRGHGAELARALERGEELPGVGEPPAGEGQLGLSLGEPRLGKGEGALRWRHPGAGVGDLGLGLCQLPGGDQGVGKDGPRQPFLVLPLVLDEERHRFAPGRDCLIHLVAGEQRGAAAELPPGEPAGVVGLAHHLGRLRGELDRPANFALLQRHLAAHVEREGKGVRVARLAGQGVGLGDQTLGLGDAPKHHGLHGEVVEAAGDEYLVRSVAPRLQGLGQEGIGARPVAEAPRQQRKVGQRPSCPFRVPDLAIERQRRLVHRGGFIEPPEVEEQHAAGIARGGLAQAVAELAVEVDGPFQPPDALGMGPQPAVHPRQAAQGVTLGSAVAGRHGLLEGGPEVLLRLRGLPELEAGRGAQAEGRDAHRPRWRPAAVGERPPGGQCLLGGQRLALEVTLLLGEARLR